MLVLSRLSDSLTSSYKNSAPNEICAYIYELAGAANKFYHDVKIISEPDEQRKASYVALMASHAPGARDVHRPARLQRAREDVTNFQAIRRGRCPHRPKRSYEFAGNFRKNGAVCRDDVGIAPYA